MPHTLILPKQTGQIDAFYASLKLYFNSYKQNEEWYDNNRFKSAIQKELPYLSMGAQDQPYLVKQSELTRYFGLVFYDYKKRRAHITDEGIRFYNAYLQNDKVTQLNIIMDSVFNDSFGRDNTAIESSDSDVDAPKLFLRSICELGGIKRKELAYLLYVTHDLKINYNDAIFELKKASDRDREIPINVSNKYNDVKFTVLLTSLGITNEIDRVYQLSDFTKENYERKLFNLSIYNRKPEITLTLRNDLLEDTSQISEIGEVYDEGDLDQNAIISSYAYYDIASPIFLKQNNREPVPYKRGNTIRYKTNPRISKTALEQANNCCEINPEGHKTFTSKLGKSYMEAHHLIPMMAQKDFSINLDRIENIVCICPVCHSGIHLGNTATRLELLKKLYDKKEKELKSVGLNISFGELFSKYYQ